jgi:hypothetical protein
MRDAQGQRMTGATGETVALCNAAIQRLLRRAEHGLRTATCF